MNPVVRGLAVYLFVFIIFRILGKRTLAEITTFDFVLLLIISETTTDALIGEDYSLVACFIMVCTLVGVDYIMSTIKDHSKWFNIASEGAPLVLVDNGKPLKNRMKKSRVGEAECWRPHDPCMDLSAWIRLNMRCSSAMAASPSFHNPARCRLPEIFQLALNPSALSI